LRSSIASYAGRIACQVSMALPSSGVDGLGERGSGLVDGHVEQADRIASQHGRVVTGDRLVVVLPAQAADAGAAISSLRSPPNSRSW
jgi:hypothetical protein